MPGGLTGLGLGRAPLTLSGAKALGGLDGLLPTAWTPGVAFGASGSPGPSSSGDGRLAPQAVAPLAPPLVTPTDTTSAGSPGNSPHSLHQQQRQQGMMASGLPPAHQQQQPQPPLQQTKAPRRSKRKSYEALPPAAAMPPSRGAAAAVQQPAASDSDSQHAGPLASHISGGTLVLHAAGGPQLAGPTVRRLPAGPPPRRSPFADVFADALADGPGGTFSPLDLPGLDDLDDVPGLDDLLLGMTAEEDALLGDPLTASLAPVHSSWLNSKPSQLHLAGAYGAAHLHQQQLHAQHHQGQVHMLPPHLQQATSAAAGQQPMLMPAVQPPAGCAAMAAAGAHQRGVAPYQPPMLNPFLRSSSSAQQAAAAAAPMLVPQPAAAAQQHPAAPLQQQLLPDMDRTGSADTRRSHTSLDLLPAAAGGKGPAAPATAAAAPGRRGSLAGGNRKSGGGSSAGRKAAATAAAAAVTAAAQQTAAAAEGAAGHPPADQGAAGTATATPAAPAILDPQPPASLALLQQLEHQAQASLPSPRVFAAMAAPLQQTAPLQLPPQLQPPPQPVVRWMSADPSILRPIKRGRAKPSNPELDVAALKLSAAALLVAEAAGTQDVPRSCEKAALQPVDGLPLLRCLFGHHYPASWKQAEGGVAAC